MYYKQGKKYLDEGKIEKAREQFTEGYAQGDSKCAYGMLAVAAMLGAPREQALTELKRVFPQLQQAAEVGDTEALFILGRCAETGSVVKQNAAEAIQYYQRAAAGGNTDAMYNLGCIYMQTGKVGEALALSWYEMAANMGHPQAVRAMLYWQRSQRKE